MLHEAHVGSTGARAPGAQGAGDARSPSFSPCGSSARSSSRASPAGTRSERDVLDCYFTSYFNAWLDNHNLYSGPKKVVTGFVPQLNHGSRQRRSILRDLPGRDARHHRPGSLRLVRLAPAAPRPATRTSSVRWGCGVKSAASTLEAHERRPDASSSSSTRTSSATPETVMGRIAERDRDRHVPHAPRPDLQRPADRANSGASATGGACCRSGRRPGATTSTGRPRRASTSSRAISTSALQTRSPVAVRIRTLLDARPGSAVRFQLQTLFLAHSWAKWAKTAPLEVFVDRQRPPPPRSGCASLARRLCQLPPSARRRVEELEQAGRSQGAQRRAGAPRRQRCVLPRGRLGARRPQSPDDDRRAARASATPSGSTSARRPASSPSEQEWVSLHGELKSRRLGRRPKVERRLYLSSAVSWIREPARARAALGRRDRCDRDAPSKRIR